MDYNEVLNTVIRLTPARTSWIHGHMSDERNRVKKRKCMPTGLFIGFRSSARPLYNRGQAFKED